MTIIRTGNGNVVDDNNALPTKTIETTIIQPVILSGREIQDISTHSGVSIAANAWNSSTWIDTHVDGSPYTKLAVSVNMASGTGMTIAVEYSADGVSWFSAGSPTLYDNTGNAYSTTTDIDVPMKWVRVAIKNKDATNAKTTTAYVRLKA